MSTLNCNYSDTAKLELDDLALDVEVLQSFNELRSVAIRDENNELWLDTDHKKFIEASEDFKDQTHAVIEGLREKLVTYVDDKPQWHVGNRVAFVQMGFRLVTHKCPDGRNLRHVLKLEHSLSRSEIFLAYA